MCKAIQDLMNDSREEGREEERKNNVKNMLNENIAVEVICRIVNCDAEYVDTVQKEVL
ncbi:MAG: hypothetical protein IJ958_10805 [Agathobacter sp.]|nr:hypothetical protein [Agathobacter sp.]